MKSNYPIHVNRAEFLKPALLEALRARETEAGISEIKVQGRDQGTFFYTVKTASGSRHAEIILD